CIMAEGDSDNLTLEQYLALTRGNQALGVVKLKIKGDVNFEIKSQFMRELREDTFSGNKNDDAHEHVERPQKGGWTDYPQEPSILGISLKRPLSKGNVRHPRQLSSLKKSVTSSRKAMAHCTRLGKDSSISSEVIATIVSKLDILGRDMKKLKETVHAIQVGCQTCRGAHLDKECPLNKEVKSMEEVKYGKFRRSSPFSNRAKYRVGPPGYYTPIENRPPFGEKRPSLEELLNKHIEESTRRRAEVEERVKKLLESTEINTQNQSASLKNLETQIKHLTKVFHAKTASEVPNSSAGQCKAVHANIRRQLTIRLLMKLTKHRWRRKKMMFKQKSYHANFHQKN
ncbi:hypothetical protein Tco_1219578, partial [Tanacetum coccineum]